MTARRETPGRRGKPSSVPGPDHDRLARGETASKRTPKSEQTTSPKTGQKFGQKSGGKAGGKRARQVAETTGAKSPRNSTGNAPRQTSSKSAPPLGAAQPNAFKATPGSPATDVTGPDPDRARSRRFPRLASLSDPSPRTATREAHAARPAASKPTPTQGTLPQGTLPQGKIPQGKLRTPAPVPIEPMDLGPPERVAKLLARLGVGSRRDVEAMIAAGRVRLNGTLLDIPAVKAGGRDRLEVDDVVVGTREPTRLWLYHKPSGLVTTHKDPRGRRTVFETLPDDLPRVVSVGRLDLTTEGLLLLTNDGELSRALELPSTGLQRSYRARAYGRVTQTQLDELALGITVEGVTYGSIDAELERVQGGNVWISVRLKEGKKREVRFALESLGLKVNRLIRTAYGPFVLGDLRVGELIEVSDAEIARLLAGLKRSQKQAKAEQERSEADASALGAERRSDRAPRRNRGGWEP